MQAKPLGPRKREHVDEVPNSCGGLTGVLTGSWQTPGVWGGSDGPLQPSFPDGSEAVFCKPQSRKASVPPEKKSCGDC